MFHKCVKTDIISSRVKESVVKPETVVAALQVRAQALGGFNKHKSAGTMLDQWMGTHIAPKQAGRGRQGRGSRAACILTASLAGLWVWD